MIERYRHDGTVRLRDIRFADKLNEVISIVNDLENHIHHLLERDAVQVQHEVTKESAKGKTPDYYRGQADQHAKDLEEIELAVEAYKKRLVEKLVAALAEEPSYSLNRNSINLAIRLVEETE